MARKIKNIIEDSTTVEVKSTEDGVMETDKVVVNNDVEIANVEKKQEAQMNEQLIVSLNLQLEDLKNKYVSLLNENDTLKAKLNEIDILNSQLEFELFAYKTEAESLRNSISKSHDKISRDSRGEPIILKNESTNSQYVKYKKEPANVLKRNGYDSWN